MRKEEVLVEVRDKNLEMVGQITHEYMDVSATKVHCGVGSWSLKLPMDHEMVPHLWTPGSGVVISVRGALFLSGPTTSPSYAASPENPSGTLTFSGVDDNVLLYDGRAWPLPSQPNVSLQTLAHDNRTGAAETVMKAYVSANIGPTAPLERRGLLAQKLLIAASLGRGASVTKSARFPMIGELLTEIATYARLGFDIKQVDDNLVFDVYEIDDKTGFVRFDLENGTLTEETIEMSSPVVTRPIVAGQGEGEDRQLLQRTDPESIEAEAEWGRKIEDYIDQRQTNILAELQQAGDEALAAGGFTATAVKAIPSDNTTMQYGVDWSLGDLVTVIVNKQETSSTVTQVALRVHKDGTMIGAAIGDVTGFNTGSALQGKVDDTAKRVEQLERATGAAGASTDLAEAITSGNLDTYVAPGLYSVNTNAHAVAITNAPVDRSPGVNAAVAGQMTVSISEDGRGVYQRYETYSNIVFVRVRFSGTWTAWERLAPASMAMPAGAIVMIGGATAAPGWALCNGGLYNRVTDAALFAAIGTTHGAGDGVTTFNVPNITERVPVGAPAFGLGVGGKTGAATHILSANEMPSHTHIQNAHNHTQNAHNHPLNVQAYVNTGPYGAGSGSTHTFNVNGVNTDVATATNQAATATNQSTGGGAAHNNVQPVIVLNFMIKR